MRKSNSYTQVYLIISLSIPCYGEKAHIVMTSSTQQAINRTSSRRSTTTASWRHSEDTWLRSVSVTSSPFVVSLLSSLHGRCGFSLLTHRTRPRTSRKTCNHKDIVRYNITILYTMFLTFLRTPGIVPFVLERPHMLTTRVEQARDIHIRAMDAR